jgi:hypothetical protein
VRFLTKRHAAEEPGLEQWFLVAIGDDEKAKEWTPLLDVDLVAVSNDASSCGPPAHATRATSWLMYGPDTALSL